MKSRYHIAVGAIISALMYLYNYSYTWIFLFFVSTIFIDLDHLIDFYLETGRLTLNVTELSETLASRRYSLIPLHSIEVVVFIMLISYFYLPLFAVSAGFIIHIYFDSRYNNNTTNNWLLLSFKIKNWKTDWNGCNNPD